MISLLFRLPGVPWTLHCWMNTLAMAYEMQVEPMIDQLLQDYLQVWPEDCSSQFVDECLPLLFTIFRHSKVSRLLDSYLFVSQKLKRGYLVIREIIVFFILASKQTMRKLAWKNIYLQPHQYHFAIKRNVNYFKKLLFKSSNTIIILMN